MAGAGALRDSDAQVCVESVLETVAECARDMEARTKRGGGRLRGPFLRHVALLAERVHTKRYPFNIAAFSQGIDIELTSNVTFFVGENGSGKSTLLEALAENCGFNVEGGSRDHNFSDRKDRSELASALRLSWLPKVSDGFFMRAESFYNFRAISINLEALGKDTAVVRSTNSPMVSRFSRSSRIALTAEFIFLTSPKPRFHRSVSSVYSVSFIAQKLRGGHSFWYPLIRRLSWRILARYY